MERTNFDAAALSGATLAAVVTVYIPKGPFGWISGIVGLVLLLILVSYESERPRTQLQSLALGAVCGLSSLLIVGLVAELIISHGSLSGIIGGNGELESQVSDNLLPAIWPFVSLLFFAFDRLYLQRRYCSPQ